MFDVSFGGFQLLVIFQFWHHCPGSHILQRTNWKSTVCSLGYESPCTSVTSQPVLLCEMQNVTIREHPLPEAGFHVHLSLGLPPVQHANRWHGFFSGRNMLIQLPSVRVMDHLTGYWAVPQLIWSFIFSILERVFSPNTIPLSNNGLVVVVGNLHACL